MSNPIHLRTQTSLRLRLSGQARLHFAQLMLWQILAFMALLAVFLLHSCGILTDQSHSLDLSQLSQWQHILYQASGFDLLWHSIFSVALLVLGKHISTNFRQFKCLGCD